MDKSEVEKVSVSSEDAASTLGRNRSFKSKQLVRSQAIRESQSPPRTSSPTGIVTDLADISISDKPSVTTNNNSATNKFSNNAQYNINNPNNNVTNNRQNNVTLLPNNLKLKNSGEQIVTVSLKNDKVRNNVVKTQSDISSHGSVSDEVGSVTSFSEKSETDECKKKPPVEIQITSGGWDDPLLLSTEAMCRRSGRPRWHRGRSTSPRDLLSNHPRLSCVCGRCQACPHCRGQRRKPPCPTKQDSGIVCSDDCPDCSDTDISGGTHPEHKKTRSVDDDQTFYCRCPERKEKPKSLSLSRSDSDPSEQNVEDLVNFIKTTLNRNPKDRIILLRIEKELHSLVTDTGRSGVRFPFMSSYHRLLVHKCAALFNLSHRVEPGPRQQGAVLVSKTGTPGGRIPCTPFIEWCNSPLPKLAATATSHRSDADTDTAKSILKRDTQSLDEPGSGALSATRSKSLEQREKDYERVRRRIFSSDTGSQDETQWPWLNAGPVKLLTSDSGRNKLLKVQSLESGCPGEKGANRAALGKSRSFEHDAARGRGRSAHGELASSRWRVSPSSSGYRTLSLHSADSVTPSPTGGGSPEPCVRGVEGAEMAGGVVWAVTDMAAVPPGAIVIHPQTGRPLTNPDGSIYHFDPAHPPPIVGATAEHKIDQNFEKRRGKLEKQHSFIENESDCQVSEECRSKCCCECQRHRHTSEKTTPPTEEKVGKTPKSPQNNHYDTQSEMPADQNAPPSVSANQRSPFETTNQKPPLETNQQQSYSPSPNQKTGTHRQFDPTNQKQVSLNHRFEIQRQSSFEQSQFELANQRTGSELGGQRLTNQESQDIQYYGPQYPQYRHEDMVSPHMVPSMVASYGQEMVLHAVTPNKIMPVADHNMRPMSLTNMMYPAPLHQSYQFVNQCRMEPHLQPLYQPMLAADEKQLAPSPHTDNTFRIDPSYPYAPTELAAPAPCCVDSAAALHHAGGGVAPYPVESAAFHQTAATVIPPAPQIHYPYPDQMSWGSVAPLGGGTPKLYVQEVYPVMHWPPLYAHYNHLLYPQMVPQYPVANVAPAATMPRLPPKRNSLPGSSRATPLQTPPDDKKAPYERAAAAEASANVAVSANASTNANSQVSANNSDIAATIQQITEQLNARTRAPQRGEWRRRGSNVGANSNSNSGANTGGGANAAGAGLLGAGPRALPPPHCGAPHYAAHGNTHYRDHGEPQLSSAARAIVNSLRNMQGKTHYQERRQDLNPSNRDGYRRGREFESRDSQQQQCRPAVLLRQMSAGTWCRRSPGPVHPAINNPRRPHPDTRPQRR